MKLSTRMLRAQPLSSAVRSDVNNKLQRPPPQLLFPRGGGGGGVHPPRRLQVRASAAPDEGGGGSSSRSSFDGEDLSLSRELERMTAPDKYRRLASHLDLLYSVQNDEVGGAAVGPPFRPGSRLGLASPCLPMPLHLSPPLLQGQ